MILKTDINPKRPVQIFCFLLVLMMPFSAAFSQWHSVKIYVSVNGSDKNTGLFINKPLQTIEAALNLAAGGDTICVLPGVYHQKIQIRKIKGKPEKPICIYGLRMTASDQVIIDGGAERPAMELENNWIECSNSEWIEFDNLVFKNGWTDPVRLENSSYISFKHCRFFGGRKVILGTGAKTHHVLVENCFWDQGGEKLWTIDKDSLGVDAWLSMHHQLMGYYNGSLVDSRGTGGSFVVRNNRIQNAYNGIRFTSKTGYDANVEIYDNSFENIRDNDVEPEHYAFNMHIYHNKSHNIHKTLSVDDVGGGYIYYYGNTVTMDSTEWAKKICSGWWKIYSGEESLQYPLYAFNNSFFGYGKAFNAMEAHAPQLKHFNNAYYFAGPESWVLKYPDSTNAFDYDLSNKPWSQTMLLNHFEQHGIIAKVGFIDPLSRNLKMTDQSPAVDAGTIMQFPELGWTQSYQGKAPDIGAYENGELVDGPAFRFRVPDNAKFAYNEKPRIVKYRVNGNKLILYFSLALKPETVKAASILLQSNHITVPISQIRFPGNLFELVIEAKQQLNEKELAIRFDALPLGENGETATYWASAIPIIKP
jgi:hypothetical protein